MVAERDGKPFESLNALRATLNMDDRKWQQRAPFVTVRSTTFRLLAQAALPNQEQPYHVEATLYSGGEELSFVRWREY